MRYQLIAFNARYVALCPYPYLSYVENLGNQNLHTVFIVDGSPYGIYLQRPDVSDPGQIKGVWELRNWLVIGI